MRQRLQCRVKARQLFVTNQSLAAFFGIPLTLQKPGWIRRHVGQALAGEIPQDAKRPHGAVGGDSATGCGADFGNDGTMALLNHSVGDLPQWQIKPWSQIVLDAAIDSDAGRSQARCRASVSDNALTAPTVNLLVLPFGKSRWQI